MPSVPRFLGLSFCFCVIGFLAQPSFAQDRACTMIGCVDGLILSMDPAPKWEPGHYDLSITLDGREVQCTGDLPLKPCEEGLSFQCSSGGVQIMEGGCALPRDQHGLGDIMIDGAPRNVSVRLARNGQVLVALNKIAPSYQVSRPNGPGCEPVCRSATESLFGPGID